MLVQKALTVISKYSGHCKCQTPLADLAVYGSLRFPDSMLLSR